MYIPANRADPLRGRDYALDEAQRRVEEWGREKIARKDRDEQGTALPVHPTRGGAVEAGREEEGEDPAEAATDASGVSALAA